MFNANSNNKKATTKFVHNETIRVRTKINIIGYDKI